MPLDIKPQAQYPRGFEGMDATLPGKLEGTQAAATIPAEKLAAMTAYAKALHHKYPKWKPARVARKTAQYFKVKLT